jgi:hypothetical protein
MPFACQAENVHLDMDRMPSNYFGGQLSKASLSLSSRHLFRGRLYWCLQVDHRVIQRAEHSFSVYPQKVKSFDLELRLPPVKGGAAIAADLQIEVFDSASKLPVTSVQKKIWILAPDLFAHQQALLKRINIHLYDPQNVTSKIFSKTGIPFKQLKSPEAFTNLSKALLVIGEGTDLNARRGFADIILSTALAGNTVLCMAAAPGTFPLGADTLQLVKKAKGVNLSSYDIVKSLDKRLDVSFWTKLHGKSTGARTVDFQVGNHQLFTRVAGEHGWPWVELQYSQPNARFVYCGFNLMKEWGYGPPPRYLLNSIFRMIAEY